MIDRAWISRQFIRGVGIEIGAFHNPWPYDPILSSVRYVDKADSQTVLDRHPDLSRDTRCVLPDLIDDGEFLSKILDSTLNFVIASHVLEHYLSPLTGIENHLRVLKSGGFAIYALPNKRHTFDQKRLNPDNSCIIGDYVCPPFDRLKRMVDHHHEYLSMVDGVHDEGERTKIALDRVEKGMDIHYHAWDVNGIYELFFLSLHWLKDFDSSEFEVVLFYPSGHEVFIILRKL